MTGSAQNPLTLNRYLYTNVNPATMVDPNGHCAQWGMSFSSGSPKTVCLTEDATLKSAYQAGYDVGGDYGGAITAQQSAVRTKRISDVQSTCKTAFSAGYSVSGCNVGGMTGDQIQTVINNSPTFRGPTLAHHLVGANWDCGPAKIGCAVDWAVQHPALVILGLGIGACAGAAVASGGTLAPACVLLAQGAVIGGGLYTGSVALGNLLHHDVSLRGWNLDDFATNADIGAATGGVGRAAGAGLSRLGAVFDTPGLPWLTPLVTGATEGQASSATNMLLKAATGTWGATTVLQPITQLVTPIAKKAMTDLWKLIRPFIPFP